MTTIERTCRPRRPHVQEEDLTGSLVEHSGDVREFAQLDVGEDVYADEKPPQVAVDHDHTGTKRRSTLNTYDHSSLRAGSVNGMLEAIYDVLEGELR